MTPPLLAFYGDDFTGSADAMEVLHWSGLRCVLFLDPPSAQQLEQFEDLQAFGVAGCSRTMSPDEMQSELRPALEILHGSGAKFVHYKTCSTFDSSPHIGSIGTALEIGRDVFGQGLIPIVVAAPNLGRYQAFGTLFARSGLDTAPFRLDRHPTMLKHPITPMQEADLREHLKAQSPMRVGLLDCLQLEAQAELDLRQFESDDALLFDVLYPSHLPRIGAAIASLAEGNSPKFILGSSGIEYALTEYWSQSGKLAGDARVRQNELTAAEQLLVLTGSCSPVNDRQIAWAEEHGFEVLGLEPARLIDPETGDAVIAETIERVLKLLSCGLNVIMHSSRGPDDPRIASTRQAFGRLGLDDLQIRLRSGRILGPQLGKILAGCLARHPLRRVAVAGGDTSGYVARQLGLTAVEAIAPVAPGSPLCRAYADNALDGVEVFFKGGQVGRDDVWGTMLHGTPAHHAPTGPRI